MLGEELGLLGDKLTGLGKLCLKLLSILNVLKCFQYFIAILIYAKQQARNMPIVAQVSILASI